jgi:hypothetical protein
VNCMSFIKSLGIFFVDTLMSYVFAIILLIPGLNVVVLRSLMKDSVGLKKIRKKNRDKKLLRV